ncbi:unnamed protein product, partial [Rotaria socialis]
SSLPSTVTGATAVVTQIPSIALTSPATTTKGSASSATSSPHHPPTSVMISSTSGN